ncbi:MAG: VOC family protein, partial [Acidimicrobiia bacterium]|nr:VOC family protein [Acidimicrobiia bacterium]
MPEFTSYPHGSPSWVDLSTTDTVAATTFYSALFGWTATEEPSDQGPPYTMFHKNGKVVAGASPISEDEQQMGMPPHWNTWVNVDDLNEVAARVPAAGGTVVVPAT